MARPADTLVHVQEPTDVAAARRVALAYAQKASFDQEDAGAVALVATEAASNLIKHGGGGDLIVRNISTSSHPLVEIIALDRGRGMPNISRCFSDGYSTAGSAGTGLGAIARASKFYDVFSSNDMGTVLMAWVGPGTEGSNPLMDVGAISAPYPGEEICGDGWEIDVSPERIRIIVADGLGHGVFASAASVAAVSAIADQRSRQPADVLEKAHGMLKTTRGAAVAVIDVDASAKNATFAGIGNVTGATVSESGVRRQMVSVNGILGHEMRAARQYQYPLEPGSLVVLHSDGLSTHWSLDKYPGLLRRHPTIIAGILFRDHRRDRDDATVVVVRLYGMPQ